jgi:cytochrome c553
MKNINSALLLTLLVSGLARADGLVDGSADAGKAQSAVCGACHGADGNSVNPEWPSLAGQHATYIVKQLQAFKDGRRSNPLMMGPVATLSSEDMADLAAYFSEQRPAPRAVADADLVDKGQSLYRGGDREKGIPACMACHGPTGAGNPAALYPALSGQYAVYTAAQLQAYASGQRTSDNPTKVMRDIAEAMTDEQITAVSSYVQGLR